LRSARRPSRSRARPREETIIPRTACLRSPDTSKRYIIIHTRHGCRIAPKFCFSRPIRQDLSAELMAFLNASIWETGTPMPGCSAFPSNSSRHGAALPGQRSVSASVIASSILSCSISASGSAA
jgi:hypothetical protein